MSSNLAKIEQLDLGSLSIGDLSNVKNSILRNALIEIRMNSKNGILSFKAIKITFPMESHHARKRSCACPTAGQRGDL